MKQLNELSDLEKDLFTKLYMKFRYGSRPQYQVSAAIQLSLKELESFREVVERGIDGTDDRFGNTKY